MPINQFEDLIVWQKSQILAVDIYKTFQGNKDFSFADQIKRASVSISNNIAEGFDRKGDKEFSHFLYISIASCSEVRSMIHLAEKLGYIDQNEKEKHLEKCIEISKITKGLIKSLSK